MSDEEGSMTIERAIALAILIVVLIWAFHQVT